MKIRIKTIAIILALAITASIVGLTVYAKTVFQQDGFSYSELDQTTVSVCGWDNRDPALDIPKELGGYYVGEIDDTAFKDNTYITSVSFNAATQLTRIGLYAFSGCSGLSGDLLIAGKIKTVDTSAFENCSSLESVSFYSTKLTTISAQCFNGCSSLKTVLLPNSLSSIDKYAFADCPQLESVTIPNSVTYINPTAFYNDASLVIYCYTGSYAQEYAEKQNISYILLDAPTPTEPPTEEPTEEPTTAPTEAPTLEPTEAPTEAIVPILGDAEGNGEIDLTDATMIQRYLAELPVEVPLKILMNGDVDGDGELTISDVTFIQRYEAEMDSIYPIGQPINNRNMKIPSRGSTSGWFFEEFK